MTFNIPTRQTKRLWGVLFFFRLGWKDKPMEGKEESNNKGGEVEEKKNFARPRRLTKEKKSQTALAAAAILKEASDRTGLAESLVVALVVKIQKSFRRKLLATRLKRLISAYSVTDAGLDTKKRGRVLLEIVDTERSYVLNMKECVNTFLKPLLASEILTESQVESIFWNFYEVYKCNKILLRKLQAAMKVWPEQNNLTTIFLNLNKMMEVYEEYIIHYQASITSLKEHMKANKAFSQFLKKKTNALGGGKTLNAFYLIMPVQRLPRYQLLLNELYKCTPESHVDRVDIGHSVERMIEVNRCINQKQKAIADSEEELSKLEGLEELLEDPKSWHQANNFIKHEGNIDVEIDGKDRQTVFCLMLPRSLVFTKRPTKKQEKNSMKEMPAKGKPARILGKAFRVITWEKIVDIYEESLDTFEIVLFTENLYNSFKITSPDEKWKESFVSLLSSRPQTVAPICSINVTFRVVSVFVIAPGPGGKQTQAEGKYKVAVGLEEGGKKSSCEVGGGFFAECGVTIPSGASDQASVVLSISSTKSKVKMGDVRVPVLHCRWMIGKAKDNMNDHPIFLKKEKVGVLRFSVVSRDFDSRISLTASALPAHSPQFHGHSPAQIIKSATFHSNRKEKIEPEGGGKEGKGGSGIGPSLSHSTGFTGRSATPPPDSVAHQSRRVRVREKRLSSIGTGNRGKISKSVFPTRTTPAKRRGSDPGSADEDSFTPLKETQTEGLPKTKKKEKRKSDKIDKERIKKEAERERERERERESEPSPIEILEEALNSGWPTAQIVEILTSCYLNVDEVLKAREMVTNNYKGKGGDEKRDKGGEAPWMSPKSDPQKVIMNCLILNADQEEVLKLREEIKLLKK